MSENTLQFICQIWDIFWSLNFIKNEKNREKSNSMDNAK